MGLGTANYQRTQRFLLSLAFGALALASGLMLAAPARAQDAAVATLVIHIHDLSPKGGMLRLGLYDEARYPDDDAAPVASADVKAELGENILTLTNVPPGVYAIETFQDINSNHKMDTSWLGFPLEPFGFSRDAQPRLSKPSFGRVKFEVVPGLNVQTLHMQNSVSLVASK
jgi:uncharacterized protein (DUF2141 family)